MSTAKPFLPSDLGPPSRHIIRAILCYARASIDFRGSFAQDVAKALFPRDHRLAAYLETKAAVVPASTTTATALAQTALGDLVINSPSSASGPLMRMLNVLRFGQDASIFVPSVSPAGVPFVAEGAPIPFSQRTLDGVPLLPKKLGLGFALTRELLVGSNAESQLRQLLLEGVAPSIDTVMFDAGAATTTRPAGLRLGVSATAATAGGGEAAMMADLSALAAIVAPFGGPIAFIGSADVIAKIKIRIPNFAYPAFATSGLASGILVCLAVNALAVAGDGEPEVSASEETSIHMEDTVPLAISAVGTPNTIAAPVRSLWQTDCIGLRLIAHMDWALRASGAIAWTQTITW